MPARNAPAENPIEPPVAVQPAVSDDDKAKAEAAAAEAAAEAEKNADKLRFVKYVVPVRAAAKLVTRPSGADTAGRTDGSRIGAGSAIAQYSTRDWANLGIEGAAPTVWNFDNDWKVSVDKLNAEQLQHLLIDDRLYNGIRFELVDGTGAAVDS